MKYAIAVLILAVYCPRFELKPAYYVSPITDPLEIKANAMAKAQGYQLPSEFRSYLPTCNHWPISKKWKK